LNTEGTEKGHREAQRKLEEKEKPGTERFPGFLFFEPGEN
jgi:hypothetical protein